MAKIFARKKHAENDFTADMLPKNRREVFSDSLKLHRLSFITYGLVIFIFCLPIHLAAIIENGIINSFYSAISAAGGEEYVTLMQEILLTKNIFAIVSIPCFMLLSVGISGMARVIRQHAYLENVSFGTDFRTGLKDNIKDMLPLFSLSGIVYALSVYAYNLSQLSGDVSVSMLLFTVALVSLLLGLPVFAYSVVLISVYSYKFTKVLRIALFLTFSSPAKTYAALAAALAPFAVQLIPDGICFIAGRSVSTLLIPVIMLGWFLFVFNRLDEKINKENFPSLVGKGLYKEDGNF